MPGWRPIRLSGQTITKTLSTVGLPAAVIGDRSVVLAMNEEMGGLGSRIRTGFGDKVVIANADANALLQDALVQLEAGHAPAVQSIPVAAQNEAPALSLHLVPIKRNARDIFTKSRAILIATPEGLLCRFLRKADPPVGSEACLKYYLKISML